MLPLRGQEPAPSISLLLRTQSGISAGEPQTSASPWPSGGAAGVVVTPEARPEGALAPRLDERAVAIQVDDEPRHLAAADVEQARCV
jgi:hypothetical protein